jgi:hypothetical protein
MLNNVGNADRALRFLIGAAALSLTIVGPKTPWGFLGLVPMLTATLGWCPLYSLLGISTCPTRKA